jgi:hypothetical protein
MSKQTKIFFDLSISLGPIVNIFGVWTILVTIQGSPPGNHQTLTPIIIFTQILSYTQSYTLSYKCKKTPLKSTLKYFHRSRDAASAAL